MTRVESVTTTRFADPWANVAIAAIGLVLLAGLDSLSAKQLLRKQLQASRGETARLEAIAVRPPLWGAFRIEVTTQQPFNSWVIYEIKVLDETGEPIASGIKETWRSFDGRETSGRRDDLKGGLDLKIDKPQSLTLAIAVLETGVGTGTKADLPEPLKFRVTVRKGVMDGRYLWAGALGSGVMALLAMLSRREIGAVVIAKTLEDSEVGARAIVGGSDSLVRVTVKAWLDETRPAKTTLELRVTNAYGEEVCELREFFGSSLMGSLASVKQDWYFAFDARDSYGFFATISPDDPVEKIELQVRDGARSAGSVRVMNVVTTQS